MHRTSNIDINLLIRAPEIEIVDIQRTLYACVVDKAVDFGVLFDDFLDERGDVGDVARVENVVGCSMAEFIGSLSKRFLCSSDNYDLLALGDEVLGHGSANATTSSGNKGTIEREGFGCHFEEIVGL
jgi:hypothetical protein